MNESGTQLGMSVPEDTFFFRNINQAEMWLHQQTKLLLTIQGHEFKPEN